MIYPIAFKKKSIKFKSFEKNIKKKKPPSPTSVPSHQFLSLEAILPV